MNMEYVHDISAQNGSLLCMMDRNINDSEVIYFFKTQQKKLLVSKVRFSFSVSVSDTCKQMNMMSVHAGHGYFFHFIFYCVDWPPLKICGSLESCSRSAVNMSDILFTVA